MSHADAILAIARDAERKAAGKAQPLDQAWLDDFRRRVAAAQPGQCSALADEGAEHGLNRAHVIFYLQHPQAGP